MSTQDKMLKNEVELVQRSKKGDSTAFGILYDHYIRYIYNFVFFKTHNKETAEDLTSQTFFKAFNSISSVDPSKSFISWLYKIAQNIVIDHYRKSSRENSKRQIMDDEWDAPDTSIDIVGDLDISRDIERMKKYLSQLSSQERDIIIMRVWQDLSYKEIADIYGKTESSCKMMYSRSLKKLRDLIPLAVFLLLVAKL